MTTFDGVGVRTGPPLPLPFPGSDRQVPAEEAEADDPDDDQAGERECRCGIDRQAAATGRRCGAGPIGMVPSGLRVRARRWDRGRRRPGPRSSTTRASGCEPDGAASRISSWSDSIPPKRRLRSCATTSMTSPSATWPASSGQPKAMPSRTSSRRLSTSWVWPPSASRARITVNPRMATSGSGLPVPHGASRRRSRWSA